MQTIDTTEFLTPRLRLRRYRHIDRERFAQLMADPDVNRYIAGGTLSASESAELFQKIVQVYASKRSAVWAVDDRRSGFYVGHAELKLRPDEPGLELVYLLDKHSWGQGLGTELARGLRDLAFQSLNSRRVLATIHPDNEPSMRILGTLGFRFIREWTEPDDDVSTWLFAADA